MATSYEMNPNRLLIATGYRKVGNYNRAQLHKLFGDEIGIAIFNIETDSAPERDRLLAYKPQLVLCTAVRSTYEIQKHYDPEKVLTLELDLNEPVCFDELFLIPEGEKALVVNRAEDTTLQVLHALQRLGINHIKYEPYWDGCRTDISEYKIAITAGMLEFCPKEIETKINIGRRSLSVRCLMKIIETYGLNVDYVNNYVDMQRKLLAGTYKQLSIVHMETQSLKDTLQTILDGLNEAIISFDDSNVITEINAYAMRMLGVTRKDFIGKRIGKLLTMIPELDKADLRSINEVVEINGAQLYATYMNLGSVERVVNCIRLKEIGDIHDHDEEVRKLLYKKNSGHIAKHTFNNIMVHDPAMRRLLDTAKVLSDSGHTVLVTGESGTGKELVAQSIHNASGRAGKPFVGVNFAALPENLIESELFGYEEGAFTGARKKGKKGLFELAHTGTIFLDEIGDASPAVQTRLLRVLEEKEVMRVGDTKVVPVDIRVIAATNKDLKKLVEEGVFRADLYYRINVFQLHIPPLRQRAASIFPFIRLFSRGVITESSFTPEAHAALVRYGWPGNIRELRNLVDYISLMAKGRAVGLEDLPNDLQMDSVPVQGPAPADHSRTHAYLEGSFGAGFVHEVLSVLDYNKRAPKVVGRNKMLDFLHARGVPCTAASLRTLLDHLESHGLLHVGKTKQGTVLSSLGESYFAWLKEGTEARS